MDQVRVLLFDLGGVVMDIDFEHVTRTWAELAGVDPASVRCHFSHDEPYARHERGEIDFTQYAQSLRETLGIDLCEEDFEKGWNAVFNGEIPEARTHLAKLAERFPLYAFTNSNPTHQRAWERDYAHVLRLFRRVFISSTMGVRKPEEAAFRAIAAELEVPLNSILFFDDTEENVESARRLGMPTIHVTGPQTVGEVTRQLLA